MVTVTSLSPAGIYTAGDEIFIQVQFSSRVMVIQPPVLKLSTGSVNRSAEFVEGNFTHALKFRYTVQPDDISPDLDYIDTRSAPYKTDVVGFSFALNTVVELSSALVTDTVTSEKVSDNIRFASC